jgi:hypothetical protein
MNVNSLSHHAHLLYPDAVRPVNLNALRTLHFSMLSTVGYT